MTLLAYDLNTTGVHGIMYFNNLQNAFATASTLAQSNANVSRQDSAAIITTWPSDPSELLFRSQRFDGCIVRHCSNLSR